MCCIVIMKNGHYRRCVDWKGEVFMKRKRIVKKVTSFCLAASLVGTLPQTFTEFVVTAEAAEEMAEYKAVITDLVQVQIGTDSYPMRMYQNGLYEAGVKLPAGTYNIQSIVNGTTVGEADILVVSEEKTVFFRFKDGELNNSISNAGMLHTAALAGDVSNVSFVNDSGEPMEIANWTPSDANAELEYIGGGMYKRTFHFAELKEDTNVEYKVAFDDGWDYSIGDGGNNIKATIPAGSTEFTIVADEANQIVWDSARTATLTVTQNDGNYDFNPLTGTVSIIGTVRGNDADNWASTATGYEFTQVSDHLYLYQKELTAGTYTYKTVFDYAKWYEKGGDRSVTLTGTQNVTFMYDAETEELMDSVNNQSEIAQRIGMEAIPAESVVKTNANGTVSFVTVTDADKVNIVYGTATDAEAGTMTTAPMSKKEDGSFTLENIYFGDAADTIVYYYVADGVKVLDTVGETVTIGDEIYSAYAKDTFAGRGVYVPGTLPGPSWDPGANEMIYKGNGLYEYTFENVPAANYEFKIAMGTWDENYGADGAGNGANIALAVTERQDVTIYYNDISHRAVTSLGYTFADITLSGSTVPENTKLKDDALTGIYSATVHFEAGKYADIKLVYGDNSYDVPAFEVTEAKDVSFFFDPDTEVYYNDASDAAIDTDSIYYNTKNTEYKSIYGAVATGEQVTFSIDTGIDATDVRLIVKGKEKKNIPLSRSGATTDGKQKWSVSTSFETLGEYQYYFFVSNGSSVAIYGDDDGNYGEGKVTDLTSIKPYDIVVYKSGYKTPDWMKNAIMYQIFPERFYDGDVSNDLAQTTARGTSMYEYVKDWYVLPENPEQEQLNPELYPSNAYRGDGNYNNEIYGGDLKGITQKIDYLKAIGVNVIYLNPVFASISSHRYDTTDYTKIDPILGELGDFEELVKVAEENDMHIVLDGVFNHVSDDSIYFDRYYKFLEAGTDTIGAYPYWAYVYDYMKEKGVDQTTAESAAKTYFTDNYGITNYTYTEWFQFTGLEMLDGNKNVVTDSIGLRAGEPVYAYEGWWGYDSMPIIYAKDGSEYQVDSWAEQIIGKNETSAQSDGSVTQYWLSEGSNGWRLDVANEVSDETWQHFRNSVKALSSDNVIIGEIWDDATKYLMGDMYDSVMNYVFRNAVLSFAKGGDTKEAVARLERLRERYPKEAFYAMMNLVASHDTTRVLSYLDGIDDDRNQKEIENAFPSYETTSELAKNRQYLVAFLQMTYPGAPMIYYGDEIGMTGADDPDDRRAFTWGKGNKEIVTYYATMAAIRNQMPVLRTGDINVFFDGEDAVDAAGNKVSNLMAYVRSNDTSRAVVLANNAQNTVNVTIDAAELGMADGQIVDVVSQRTYTVAGGKVTVDIDSLRGVILVPEADNITVELDEDALSQAYDPGYIIAERKLAEKVGLNKSELTLESGKTQILTAKVTPEEAIDTGVKWISSDSSIVKVDENGKVTAVKAGRATITAQTASGAYSVCNVTVKAAVVKATSVSVDKKTITLAKGKTTTIKATVRPANATEKATFTSSDSKIVKVDSTGKITAVKSGTATITIKAGNKSATCKVTVTSAATKLTLSDTRLTIEKGKTKSIKAKVTPSDSTDKIEYTSANTKIAKVSSTGVVTAKKAGTTTITVKAGKLKKTVKVTVKISAKEVKLNKTKLTLKKGKKQTLKATLRPADATDRLTFTSSNKNIVTVDSKGRLTAKKAGTATITVKAENGKKATCKVTVK